MSWRKGRRERKGEVKERRKDELDNKKEGERGEMDEDRGGGRGILVRFFPGRMRETST